MDWDAYKRRCDTPDVISRWMLEQTAELLEGALRVEVEAALTGLPLPKPDDHKGGAATDMFQLELKPQQVLAVHARVVRAVTTGEVTSGTRNRGLGGFEEAWREYVDYLKAAHVR